MTCNVLQYPAGGVRTPVLLSVAAMSKLHCRQQRAVLISPPTPTFQLSVTKAVRLSFLRPVKVWPTLVAADEVDLCPRGIRMALVSIISGTLKDREFAILPGQLLVLFDDTIEEGKIVCVVQVAQGWVVATLRVTIECKML